MGRLGRGSRKLRFLLKSRRIRIPNPVQRDRGRTDTPEPVAWSLAVHDVSADHERSLVLRDAICSFFAVHIPDVKMIVVESTNEIPDLLKEDSRNLGWSCSMSASRTPDRRMSARIWRRSSLC